LKKSTSARYVIEAALAVSLAALAGAASAVPGYVTSIGETPVMSGSGLCWRTGEWGPDKARDPCDPVARAAAPAAAPVAEQRPAPAPAPIAAAPVEQPKPPVIQKLTLSTDVLFPFGKADLAPGGQAKLDELAQTAQGAEVDRVVIVGNADRIGSEQSNQELSERRAQAVKQYLASKGVAQDRVQAEGRGESQPVTGDQCKGMGPERKGNAKLISCLQPDRRVEIEVLGSREVAAGTSGSPASSGSSAPSGSSVSTQPSGSAGSSGSGTGSSGSGSQRR
jgi:OOP family OmpA-OmpF porin